MTNVPRSADAPPSQRSQPLSAEGLEKDRRSPILPTLVLLLVVNAVTIGAALYSRRMPVATAEASSAIEAEPVEVAAEEAEEEGGGGSFSPQRAVGSPGRKPASPRASTPPRQATYRRRGNISDLFCRPVEGESVEQWLARVPAYCLQQ